MTQNKSRCLVCNKQMGLLPFKCKCGNEYCSNHRFEHACTFDYRAEQRGKLTDKLPKVVASKLNTIK